MRFTETFWKGLLTGQFRHWRRQEYALYRHLFGPHKHVGIEIETLKVLSDEWVTKVLEEVKSPLAKRTHIHEYQVLFPTSSPKEFVGMVYRFVEATRKHMLPTSGSVHINLEFNGTYQDRSEFPPRFLINKFGGGFNGGGVYRGGFRYENKAGAGFFNTEDLLIQLVAAAYYFRYNWLLPKPLWYPKHPMKVFGASSNPLLIWDPDRSPALLGTTYTKLKPSHIPLT